MVVLPLPEPPTSATRRPGLDGEVEVADERLVQRAVAEGEAADLQASLELGGAAVRGASRRRPSSPGRGRRLEHVVEPVHVAVRLLHGGAERDERRERAR